MYDINLKKYEVSELNALLIEIQLEIADRDPKRIAEEARHKAWQAEVDRKHAELVAYSNRVLATLKKILKPGDTLKMKGCKDGSGIREFIEFDKNDSLVCWQIAIRRQWVKTGMGDKGYFDTTKTKTNCVTTHMPDKVMRVNGIPIRELL